MNILVISNLYPPAVLGGYELLCQHTVEALRSRGHRVHVLTTPADDAPPQAGVERTLRLYRPFHQRPRGMDHTARWVTGRLNVAATQACIERVQPDVIFVWSQLRLTLGATRAALASGRPVAFTLNDEHLAGYRDRPWSGGLRDLGRLALERTLWSGNTLRGLELEHVTCISHCLRANLQRQGVPVGKATVIHQGVSPERFPPRPDLDALHEPPRLLYAGQLHPYKGVHTLVEAAAQVARTRPLRLTIAGTGPQDYVDSLRALAGAQLELEFLGKVPQDDLPAVYRSHDLFVFPSIWEEPFGLTHLEAMASGLPVVSTAHGGQGEFLQDGRNCLVFPPGDPVELACRLHALLDSPLLRRELALGGLAAVRTFYNLSRYVQDLESWLSGILTEKRRTA